MVGRTLSTPGKSHPVGQTQEVPGTCIYNKSEANIRVTCRSNLLDSRVHRMPMGIFFSSQSTNKGNRKLPFYMGFKSIEKFFGNCNVSCSHQRAEVTENRDFS